MTTKDYIDTGDRVVVKDVENFNCGFGSSSVPSDALGLHGIVLSQNGFGHCRVRLDDGREFSCWNGKNLDWESK